MSKKKNSIVLLAIKPKYAEAIYAGKKRWEFRKAPPPVPGWVFLYESAPVSAITGKVFLGAKIQGNPGAVWGFARTQKTIGGSVGIAQKVFLAYVGKASSVAACACFFAEKFPNPISLTTGVRPPQNWGRYFVEESEGSHG